MHQKKHLPLRRIFVLLVLSLVISCTMGTRDETKYYLLDSVPHIDSEQSKKPPAAVNTISLPQYLQQPNLVVKTDDNKMAVSRYHVWADSPDSAIKRQLINELNDTKPNYFYQTDCSNCPSISVDIEHFYPTLDGDVVLYGYFKNSVNDQSTAFSLKREMRVDGYDESVRTMRLLIGDLAKKINAEM